MVVRCLGAHDRGMTTKARRLVVTIVALGALVAVVVVALVDTGVRTYPAGSPEAGMQAFLQDLFDEDFASAHDRLAPALAAGCSSGELRYSPAEYQETAEITDVAIAGDVATLTVVFADEGGLLEPTYEERLVFEMQLIDGDWLITGLDERFDCR